MAKSKKLTPDQIKKCKAVCREISVSLDGLNKICKRHKVGPETFYVWIEDSIDNEKRYAYARELQGELLFDEARDVATKRDEDHTPFTGGNVVQRDRLIVDTYKWAAAKLRPKKYGDKVDLTSDGEKIQPVSLETLAAIASKINGNAQ